MQRLFCSQPPTRFRSTTRERHRRQKEKRSRDLVSSRNGTGPQNASLAPPPFCLPMSISPLEANHRHTLLLHPWLLPWQLFVFPAQSLRGGLSQPIIKKTFYRTNTHACTHYSNSATVLIRLFLATLETLETATLLVSAVWSKFGPSPQRKAEWIHQMDTSFWVARHQRTTLFTFRNTSSSL